MKKLLLCLALLLVALTACDESSSNSVSPLPSPSLEVRQTEPATTGAASTPNNAESTVPPVKSSSSPAASTAPSTHSPAPTASTAKDAASLIPAGWHLLKSHSPSKAEGDLNKDGIPDLAMIIERTEEGMEAPRSLLIAFGTKENTYFLSILAEHVILSAGEGGVFGDPFNGLTIDRGSVVVRDYGGSNTKWYHTYRLRFQDEDWYMIGATVGSTFLMTTEMGMGIEEDDYNLLTGDYIHKRTNKAGEEEVTKGNRGKKPLVKLSEFNGDEI
jgi:hypothetical protein